MTDFNPPEILAGEECAFRLVGPLGDDDNNDAGVFEYRNEGGDKVAVKFPRESKVAAERRELLCATSNAVAAVVGEARAAAAAAKAASVAMPCAARLRALVAGAEASIALARSRKAEDRAERARKRSRR